MTLSGSYHHAKTAVKTSSWSTTHSKAYRQISHDNIYLFEPSLPLGEGFFPSDIAVSRCRWILSKRRLGRGGKS